MHWQWWMYYAALLALIAGVWILRKWLLPAIRMHRKHVVKARSEWEPTDAEQLTPEMKEFVGRTVMAFRAIGFEVVLNARRAGTATGIHDVHKLLLINRTTQDTATALIVRTAKTCSTTVSIVSAFSDGRRIATGSRQGPRAVPPNPLTDGANFSHVSEPAALWAAHMRRLDRAGRLHEPRIGPTPGAEREYQRAEENRNRIHMIECGYFYKERTTGNLRLTWKGAFLMTWKLTPPINRWRIRLAERKARRLWDELGLATASSPASRVQSTVALAVPADAVAIPPGRQAP